MAGKTRVVALANQKGGVGKTTTAINLGAALAEKGNKTLILDLDPQGNATTGLGIGQAERTASAYDVIVEGKPIKEAILKTKLKNLSILPGTSDLSSADVALMNDKARLVRLRQALDGLEGYRYIFIDCPPALNLLTLNAFAASDSVLVPLQAEFFALEGLSQLMLTVKEVREALGSTLFIEGVVLTMFDRRNKLAQQVELDVRQNLGDMVYDAIIPRSVKLSEAPSFGEAAIHYDAAGLGSQAYLALGREFIKRGKKRS